MRNRTWIVAGVAAVALGIATPVAAIAMSGSSEPVQQVQLTGAGGPQTTPTPRLPETTPTPGAPRAIETTVSRPAVTTTKPGETETTSVKPPEVTTTKPGTATTTVKPPEVTPTTTPAPEGK